MKLTFVIWSCLCFIKVAETIETVYRPDNVFILITLATDRIKLLCLEINTDVVCTAILKSKMASTLKLKPSVNIISCMIKGFRVDSVDSQFF